MEKELFIVKHMMITLEPQTNGNGIIKVTLCNYGFEYAKDRSNDQTCPK